MSASGASDARWIQPGEPGPRTLALREELVDLQFGRRPDPRGWRVPVV